MLTKKRKEVLDFIQTFNGKHGYAPTMQDISNGLGLKSTSTVHYHMSLLAKDGLLIDTLAATQPQPTVRTTPQLNDVILGDALAVLDTLPSNHFQVIIADPPYNIGKDFGNNQDNRDLTDYVAWSKQWLTQLERVLAPGGTMYIYGFSEILAYLSVELKLPKRWLIWHYTNKNVASLNFWQRSHEAIVCAWKEKQTFNRDSVREPYTESFLNNAAGKTRKGTIGRFSKSGKETTYNAHELGALPRDVIKVPALAGGAGLVERWFLCRDCDDVFAPRELKSHADHDVMKHPTQKPLTLTKKLLQAAMPTDGGNVLIPFLGSGAEAVAAKQLGYNYLGIELNPEYVELAKRWLNKTPAQAKLL